MPPRQRLRPHARLVLAAPRARRDVHEGHPGARPREEAREGAPNALQEDRGQMTARDASRYILDRVAKMLEEEGGPVGEAVKMIASAKRVFVYGVGRSGLVARAFAMRLTQLGLDTFFIGETITPIVKMGDLVIIVSSTGTTMSAVQTANIAPRPGGGAGREAVEIRAARDAVRDGRARPPRRPRRG